MVWLQRSTNRIRLFKLKITIMNPLKTTKHDDPHRWVVFLCICLVYFFVYFHRVSPSVIVSDLISAFNTNATALGFMASMYFYLYALEQPLVGFLADLIGPRKVIGYWSVIAAVGCFIFGLAPSIGWASVGRALIGLGVGGVYVPAVKSFSQWFRPREFATMVGLLMAVGNFGAVIATTPLAWAVGTWGWRAAFFIIGGITLVLAFTTLKITRDFTDPSDSEPHPAKRTEGQTRPHPSRVLSILTSMRFWLVATIFFGVYGTLITLQGLWATPFLMTVLGIERVYASNLNMLIPVGVILGSPFIGWLTGRFGLDKARALCTIVLIYAISWIGINWFYAQIGLMGLCLSLLVMGFAGGGFISTLWGFIQETTPADTLGLMSGMLNPAPFFGVAAYQVITGAILDRNTHVTEAYTVDGFQNAFTVCFVSILICLVLALILSKAFPASKRAH
jgi:sugar phosphate permease